MEILRQVAANFIGNFESHTNIQGALDCVNKALAEKDQDVKDKK